MAEGEKKNRKRFQVAYVGDDANDHSMDVEALAPALLAFSKLIKAADAELNQKRTTIKVLVDSNFEHKCFLINFETLQVLLDTAKDFLNDEGVKTAGEVLQKVGVLGATVATGVFGYLKWRNGRKVGSVQEVKDSPGAVVIKIEGTGHTLQISSDVFRLAQNPQVLEAVEGTLTPVKEQKGARAIEFRQDDSPLPVVYKKEDVEAIIASCEDPGGIEPAEEDEEETPKIVTAVLYAHGPLFDAKAQNWRFLYKKKSIYADVRDTTIAKDAVKRGAASMNDRYKVRMEIKPPTTEDGPPHYRIIEVLDFTIGDQQINMPLKPARKKAKKNDRKRA